MSLAPMILLRRELTECNLRFAQTYGLPHSVSYGDVPTVAYHPTGSSHGNFLPASYRAILANRDWSRRLSKSHTQRRLLPQAGHRWCELDSSTSSDALLMNVFCHPTTLRNRALRTFLQIEADDCPIFGCRVKVPLRNGMGDRTEVDMRIGRSLFESKLTETDFQSTPKKRLHLYRDFDLFECNDLPQSASDYFGYQLIRNVLAAFARNCSFILVVDARRPDLIEQFYQVIRAIKYADLRCRCRLLLWQELSSQLSRPLKLFLLQKYGITYG